MRSNLARQIFVTISLGFCIFGFLLGSGILGTAVQEQGEGSLSDDATLLAPAGPAFSFWSVIYLGLLVYTIWQWLPSQVDQPRHRALGWLAGISMLLNALWLLVAQQDWIWVSVLVIFVLVACLALMLVRMQEIGATRRVDSIITDGTFGIYLGWVLVATCANVAGAGDSSGWDLGELGNRWVAVAVLLVAVAINLFLAARYGARLAVALASGWGLAWIAVGRLTDEPHDTTVGVVAIAATVVVVGGAALLRLKRRPTPIGEVAQ